MPRYNNHRSWAPPSDWLAQWFFLIKKNDMIRNHNQIWLNETEHSILTRGNKSSCCFMPRCNDHRSWVLTSNWLAQCFFLSTQKKICYETITRFGWMRQTTQVFQGAMNLLVTSCRDATIIGHEPPQVTN